MQPNTKRPTQDSHNLDFLRATAVSLVVVFHLLLFFGKVTIGHVNLRWMGLVGVLLFFVHTSLVLMFSLDREQTKLRGAKLYWSFVLRRCFRIYPLSILAVTIIYLLQLPMSHLAAGHMFYIPTGAFGFLSNILLVQNLTNKESILGPLWSLPYEMQMYLFLPFLFLFANRIRSIRPLIGLWFVAVGVAIFHARFGHMPDVVKYIPCFIPGIIAYKIWSTSQPRWPFKYWPLALGAIVAAAILFVDYERGWVICLMTGLLVPRFVDMPKGWVQKSCQMIAKYSYGIYLGHYICLWAAFVKFAFLPMAARWAIFLVTVVALPVLVFHTIEEPMIKVGKHLAQRVFSARTAPRVRTSLAAMPDAG